MPDSTLLHGSSVLSNSDLTLARKALDAMRRRHMLTVQDALVMGVPAGEVIHDAEAFARGVTQLVALRSEVLA